MSDAPSLETVSVEQDGRVLSGVGVPVESLEKTMERHAPPEPEKTPEVALVAQSVVTEQPKQTRGAKRIDQITHEREAAKREAEVAKAEAADLRVKLEAAEKARAVAPVVEAPRVEPAKEAPVTRAKPTPDLLGTKYPTYEDYIEDLADWKAEQRLANVDFDARIRERIESDRATRTLQDKIRDVFAAGPKVYSDFDAVLSHSTIEFTPDKQQAILNAPNPEHLMYALAKDDALAQRLATEPDPMRFGFELARLVTAAGVASPASTPAVATVIPPPMQPVGGGSSTTVPPSAELAKHGFDFDRSGYREKRAAERGIRRMK